MNRPASGGDGGRGSVPPVSVCASANGAAVQPSPIMFTVDVEGDWGGSQARAVREAFPVLLELLDRHSVTATFFVVANLVALVREVLRPDSRHEVGSHGLTHRPLTRLSGAGR